MGMKQGVALENSTSTSQQDLQSYPQQPAPTATSHSPTAGHYIYQQSHSPVPPQSPVSIDRFENFHFPRTCPQVIPLACITKYLDTSAAFYTHAVLLISLYIF